MLDYLIKNAVVLDGTGKDRYAADIGIAGEHIKTIGHLEDVKAEEVIDATNMFVMPGIIDAVNHSDTHWTILEEPSQESLLRQGITTIIGGNCGSSLAPSIEIAALESIRKWADISQANINWKTLGEFLDELERHPLGVNFCTLVGHGTLKRNVFEDMSRKPTEEDVEKMNLLLNNALNEGAFGISFGLAFSQNVPAHQYEINTLVSVVEKNNGVAAFHMRDEGKNLLASIGEVIDITRTIGVSTEISHLKAIGRSAWERFPNALEILRSAKKEGLDINANVFPYERTGSLLFTLLPEWAKKGEREKILASFRNPQEREKILDGIRDLTLHFDRFTIASTLRKSGLIGKTLEEAAAILNMTPEETMVELLLINELTITIFGQTLQESNIETLLKEPFIHISSDGIGKSGDSSWYSLKENLIHPRSFGTVPRVLGRYVREKKIISWEKAIEKMTGAVADKFHIKKRGKIMKGYSADLVIFDPDKIIDKATYENPYQYPYGIERVFINGVTVVQKGIYRGALEGKVLRRS